MSPWAVYVGLFVVGIFTGYLLVSVGNLRKRLQQHMSSIHVLEGNISDLLNRNRELQDRIIDLQRFQNIVQMERGRIVNPPSVTGIPAPVVVMHTEGTDPTRRVHEALARLRAAAHVLSEPQQRLIESTINLVQNHFKVETPTKNPDPPPYRPTSFERIIKDDDFK